MEDLSLPEVQERLSKILNRQKQNLYSIQSNGMGKNDKKSIGLGCWYDCRYCSVKWVQCTYRNKRDWDNWKLWMLNKNNYNKNFIKDNALFLFPANHDIIPNYNRRICFKFIRKLILPSKSKHNRLILCSKPSFAVFSKFENWFTPEEKDQIILRLSLTSNNDKRLQFWEPNAPSFEERFKCAEFLYSKGWNVSFSILPYLDSPHELSALVDQLSEFTNSTILIGYMKKIKRKALTMQERPYYSEIRYFKNNKNLEEIIKRLRNNNKIRYDREFFLNKPLISDKIPEIQKGKCIE